MRKCVHKIVEFDHTYYYNVRTDNFGLFNRIL